MPDLVLPPLHAMRAWLRDQPSGRVIGMRLATEGCPLHTWLLTVFPGPVVVDEETIQVGVADGTTVVFPTPEDYRAAMHQLDYLGGFDSGIRAEEARAVVHDVVREYREEC